MELTTYHNNVELYRAINDLKLGQSVIIEDCENKIEIYAAENFDFTSFNCENIIVSNKRAKYLFDQDNVVAIDLSNHKNKLFIAQKIIYSYDKNIDVEIKEANNLEKLAIKLAKIANLLPVIISRQVKDKFSNLIKLSAENIDNYSLKNNLKIREICQTSLKLKHASNCKIIAFRDNINNEYYAIKIGNYNNNPTIRIHSSCYTGDLLGSLACDCGDQLTNAIKYMDKNPGIIIYLMQEGRSIGLINKLRAYNLQNNGFDTVEANQILGFEDDERDFTAAIMILKALDINKINLLSNNPRKINIFKNSGIEVNEVIPLKVAPHEHNEIYLKTKASKLGHII